MQIEFNIEELIGAVAGRVFSPACPTKVIVATVYCHSQPGN